jgi:hypothetical protein
MIRHGTSPGLGHETLPPKKSQAGKRLAVLALLYGPLLFPSFAGASQSATARVEGPLLPELSRADDSSAASRPVLRSRLAGFPGQIDPVPGVGTGTWFEDEQRRMHGMGTRLTPFAPAGLGLAVEATHVNRALVGTDPGQASGRNDVWGLAAYSRLLDERLLLQGEYAVSRQSREPAGTAGGRQAGQAHNLLARYRGAPSTLAGRPTRWGLEFRRAYAETGFWSLANLDHPRDLVVDRASSRLGWGRLDAVFSVSRANEVRPAGVPERRLDTQAAELGYRAAAPAWLPGDGAWLGPMRYRLAMQRQWSGGPSGNSAADLYTESANLSARFAPGPWWWEIGHARTATYRDGSGARLDGNDFINLRLHLPLGERFSFMPELKWGSLEGPWGDDSMIMSSLQSSATLIPDRLHARLVLRASHRDSAVETLDASMLGVESSVSWALRAPRAHSPGMSLSLRGRYQHTETAANAPADFQAFAQFEVTWSPVN